MSAAGEHWLAAAVAGGLPEPTLLRWQPLRVGIVNLWEYDRAEFWFADGRLVLRGGNGAGKTKVLELTTLMLLRGEISPSVLDPFGSQHRTMRFNLLPTGDGDDPRQPTDSGLGYAWAEFGRRDEDGEAHYFTCGLGASARRGSGTSPVSRWLLLSHRRPGRDFQLSVGGRPLDQKELRKLDGVDVLDNAGHYRARLASELFGLEPEAFDNLTELLKQLRKPKLGERLNPTSLAETLRDALPALATNEIEQLAEGWDRLEQLRKAVEQTKTAALRIAQFVNRGWRPWASILVRRRADQFASATTTLDNTTTARRQAETRLSQATHEVQLVEGELVECRTAHQDAGTELRELLDSRPFQDAMSAAQRVEGLRGERRSLDAQRGRARQRATGLKEAAGRATRALEEERLKVRAAQAAVEEAVRRATSTAEPAGLLDSANRHVPAGDLPALRAELELRVARLARLRELHEAFTHAQKAAERSAQTVNHGQDEVATATRDRDQAEQALSAAVDDLRQQIREWASSAAVSGCTVEQVEHWCDMVADLTGDAPSSTPAAAIRSHLDGVRHDLRNALESLRGKLNPLIGERDEVQAQLAAVRARRDQPPPQPVGWHRRERPEPSARAGAPLWRCVQPVDGLPLDQLDLLEATMAAAGLLDAWLTTDGQLHPDAELVDVLLDQRGSSQGDTLATVLAATPAAGVSDGVIRSVLQRIGWHASRPADEAGGAWLARDGSWRVGPLTGRAAPSQPASYLGATTREAARLREIGRLENRRDELTALIDELTTALARVTAGLATLEQESARIPREHPVAAAATLWHSRCDDLVRRQEQLVSADAEHRERENTRDARWGEFAQHAGLYALPLRNLDELATALGTYRSALDALASALGTLELRTSARDTAEQHVAEQQELLAAAEGEVGTLEDEVRIAEVRLRTAEQALNTGHQHYLSRRDELDVQLGRLEKQRDGLTDRLGNARVAAVTAEQTLTSHEERRHAAEQVRDAALAAWWETFDAGLAVALGLAEPDRRVVETAKLSTRAARRELTVTADTAAEERAWRRCYEQLERLKHELLPNRDVRVVDRDDSGIQLVLVLTDDAWQPPTEAADALATRVRDQEATFDAEQQRVLTTLLGSTFIEHLKERLDYTARTFEQINTQLATHPTRQGHAVRLRWEADPTDPDASAVVTALSQGYQLLGAQRQEMVRSFLARKIDTARADASADQATDWKDQLSAALDYRRWLRISLQYRPGAGSTWVPFDTAKHAAKSGGEKVVLLSQPLFAAAVVAYNSADERAPRCVWLDEAMTGVDAEYKASFMGLTVDFNLDVMLTAHDEWCKYPTVPAVAIYDLRREQYLPGVDAMPYLWCGGRMTQVELPSEAPPMAEGLFALADAD